MVLHLEEQAAATEATVSGIHAPGRLLKSLLVITSVVSVVFSSGVAYSVWIGANASDAEVQQWIGDHDEEELAHPPLRDALGKVETRVEKVEGAVEEVRSLQNRLDKRSEYQFEFSRWQARVLEARRKRRSPPAKPAKLQQLETDLMLGHY